MLDLRNDSYKKIAQEADQSRKAKSGAGSVFDTTDGKQGYAGAGVSNIKSGGSVASGGIASAENYIFMQGTTGRPVGQAITEAQTTTKLETSPTTTNEPAQEPGTQRIQISPGVASKLSGKEADPTSKYYVDYRRERTTKSESKPINEIRAAPPSDKFTQTAREFQFKADREKETFRKFGLQTAAFGISAVGGFTKPLRNPVSYFAGMFETGKSLITSPFSTIRSIGNQALTEPAVFTGDMAGQGLFFKGASKASPVTIKKVVDLNLPKDPAKATALVKGEALDAGKSVFNFVESTEKGMTTGYKVEFPLIKGKKSGYNLPQAGSPGSKGSITINSPAYNKFLDQNPLYKQLLETTIEKPAQEVVIYKTEVVKQNGQTIIRDRKIVTQEPAGREIEIVSGGDSPIPQLADDAGSSGDASGLGSDMFKGIGQASTSNGGLGQVSQLLSPKKRVIVIAEPEVIRPFVKTGETSISNSFLPASLTKSSQTSSSSMFPVSKSIGSARQGLGVIQGGKSVTNQFIGQRSNIMTASKGGTLQKQNSASKTIQSLIQSQGQAQSIAQVSSQKQSQVLVSSQKLGLKQLQSTRLIEKMFPPINARNKGSEPAVFSVQLRRFGKWQTLAKGQSLENARSIGYFRARNTLGRSIRFFKGDKPFTDVNLPGFRTGKRNKNIFVERSSYALNTPGELTEIGQSRKKRKNKLF